jgi:hypothetical protein
VRYGGSLLMNIVEVCHLDIASKTAGVLLPATVLGRPSKAPGTTPVAV